MNDHSTEIKSRVGRWHLGVRAQRSTTAEALVFYDVVLNRLSVATSGAISNLTLSAIWDRAIFSAAERHPVLNALTIEDDRIDFTSVVRIADADRGDVDLAFAELITAFLDITGRLSNYLLIDLHYAALEYCSEIASTNPNVLGGRVDKISKSKG